MRMFKVCYRIHSTGALILLFKPFGEFSRNNGILEFDGDWKGKETSQTDLDHAMLVVGVRRTGKNGFGSGLAFLVQDSSPTKPFGAVNECGRAHYLERGSYFLRRRLWT
jgi:hypothetical protein